MEAQAWMTLGVVALTFAALALTRVGPDLVMMGALTLLLTLGVLKPAEALAGFGSEALVTVGVLLVVSAAMRETGAMAFLTERLLGRPRSVAGAQARLVVTTAAMSAFIFNAPLVAMMLPVVNDWAKKHKIPPSQVMLPLSYAAILGGVCTLIGTG